MSGNLAGEGRVLQARTSRWATPTARFALCGRAMPRVLRRLRAATLAALCCIGATSVAWALGGGQFGGQAGTQSGAQTGTQTGSMAETTAAQSGISAGMPYANQSMLYPGEDFHLSAGDLIEVRVYMQDYSQTVRLGLDGSAQLPFIGSVPLDGLSVRAAQSLIADRLRTGGYYQNPEVIVQVLDTVNSSVLVTGEVHTTVPVSTERSLRDVLLAAGGLPASASHTVKIVRPGLADPIVVDLGTDLASSTAANIPVHPHDIIQITRASVVYVLGAFARQGAVPLDQATPLTLLQLTALSGGIGWEGRYNDLRLIRTVGDQRKLIKVNIQKIRDGKAPDPVLQSNDIVFLPTNSMKAALKNMGTGGVIGIAILLLTVQNW